jgi:hypothetical protein
MMSELSCLLFLFIHITLSMPPVDMVITHISFHRYEIYYKRFRSIFKIPYYPLPAYYLPGNHDTGYVSLCPIPILSNH